MTEKVLMIDDSKKSDALLAALRTTGMKGEVLADDRRRSDDLLAATFIAAAAGWTLPGVAVGRSRDDLEGVDVMAEYQLILRKKSSLSARMRAAVVRRAERKMNEDERT